jgi:hypothetical protein
MAIEAKIIQAPTNRGLLKELQEADNQIVRQGQDEAHRR